jgi:MFS family permease
MVSRIAEDIGANRVVLALSVARLGDAVGNSILFIVLPLYVAKLPAPWFPLPESVLVGLLISLYGFVNALLQPIMGGLTDRVSRRKPFIQAGLILMGVSSLAFVFASRFTDLLLMRALQGVGVALTIPASMALMATATEKRTRGGSMGVYSTMRMVGFAIGPLIGGFLHDHFGFNTTFFAGTASICVGLILVQIWVKEVPGDVTSEAARSLRIIDRDLLTAGILGLGIATFTMASAFSMMTTLENEFNARLNSTALGFSIAFSALMVSRLIFQIPLGRLSDRAGRKRLIIGGLLLMAPTTALLGVAATTLELTGLRLLQGLASAAIAAPAFALAADLSRTGGEGRQMSIITMGFGLGIAIGPLIAGILAVFLFDLPFLVGGGMSLLGAWIVLRHVPETVGKGAESAPPGEKSHLTSSEDKTHPRSYESQSLGRQTDDHRSVRGES